MSILPTPALPPQKWFLQRLPYIMFAFGVVSGFFAILSWWKNLPIRSCGGWIGGFSIAITASVYQALVNDYRDWIRWRQEHLAEMHRLYDEQEETFNRFVTNHHALVKIVRTLEQDLTKQKSVAKMAACIDQDGETRPDVHETSATVADAPPAGVSSFSRPDSSAVEHPSPASAGAREGCGSSPLPAPISRPSSNGQDSGSNDPADARSSRAGRTKLYVVVRSDLSPGAKAVQGAHALRAFAVMQEEVERAWWNESNTLVMLEASWSRICALEEEAHRRAVAVVRWVEPDWDPNGTLTAIVLGPDGKKLVRDLPLAYASDHGDSDQGDAAR